MTDLRPYLIAIAVGVLVGAIYGLLNVRFPAPPVVALVGLLGMLLGEQIPPLATRLFSHGTVEQANLQGNQSQVPGAQPVREPHCPKTRQSVTDDVGAAIPFLTFPVERCSRRF